MRSGNTVKFTHMTLGLVPEIFYAIDMIMLVCKQLGMVNSVVFKIAHIQYIITAPAIGIHDAVRNDNVSLFVSGIICV